MKFFEQIFKKSEDNKEQKEKEPEISYHFLYAPHGTAEDAEKLKSAFDQCDIYVPEAPGWASKHESFFKDISEGDLNLKQLAQMNEAIENKTFLGAVYAAIHESRKPILFADIPKTDQLVEKHRELEEFGRSITSPFFKGALSEAIERARSYVVADAKLQLDREEKIKENLKIKLKKFLEKHPEYAKKEKLKVLISLGDFHTHLYQDLKKEGLNVSREFNQELQVYDSLTEARRRAVFDKEISDELLARSIVEQLLRDSLESLTNDTNKIDAVLRKISSQLDLKTIRHISAQTARVRTMGFGMFLLELRELNIKIPESEQEIDEMLGIK